VKITFHGVRGSTPCPCESGARYGGNTSCVVVNVDGEAPIVLDLGTGLRSWGDTQPLDGSFRATALVTHFHFDHVQGLPFLAAADRVGAHFDIYGPGETGTAVNDQLLEFVRPPFFPVSIDQLRGTYKCHDVLDDDLPIGNAKVRVRPVPHVGLTVGYRIDADNTSVAYIPDHQAPADQTSVADSVLELCDGVDLLIHDAQYNAVDWETKSHWGHCTVDYALEVARQSGARALALFHHDPSRSDDAMDALTRPIIERGAAMGIEVFAAAEGISVCPGKPMASQVRRHVAVGPMFSGRC
jgi:phosphoribosyl 1,2-cyclic phosphodiesterase